MHKEIELINNLLRDEFKSLQPQPLDGLTSQSSSVRRPNLPTPLREMAPAMRDASAEIKRNEGLGIRDQTTNDSYFPSVYGMESTHTIPPQGAALPRKAPGSLNNAKSEADLRMNASSPPLHPAHRPAVSGQSRFPNFSRLKPSTYKEG